MKKNITVALLCLLCIMFSSCSSETVLTTTKTVSSTTKSTIALEEKTENKTSEKNTTSASTNKIEPSSKASAAKITTTAKNNTAANTTKPTKKTSAASDKNQPQKQTRKQTTTKETEKSSSFTCSITIECTYILSNMTELKAGHEDYVPNDGYFVKKTSVTCSDKDTVFDVIQSVCSKNGLKLSYSGTSSKYITGINNIDEKDCGKQTGWVYTVNGKSPSTSVSKYVLSEGDNIHFYFTNSN